MKQNMITINNRRAAQTAVNLNYFLFLGAMIVAALAIHSYSFINLNMNVIDEMQYILGIKHGLNSSAYPSPIYFSLYSIIGNETSNLKVMARFLNLIIFMIGVYPIYKISLKYTDEYTTIFTVALYLFSPYSWYVNNVMPEILFGTIFYWMIYITTCKRLNELNVVLLAVILNLLIGVKNHGVFAIPIVSIFLYFKYREKEINAKKIILFYLIFSALKIIFDIYQYGQVVLFSKVYSSVLSQSIEVSIDDLIKKTLIVTIGNITLGAAFFLTPILIYIGNKDTRSNFSTTIFLGYVIFLLMTILFSIKVSNNPGENILRIHNRYYAFYTPLLFIASFEVINKINQKRLFLILLGSLSAVFFGYVCNKFYLLSYIDNADNNALFLSPIYLCILPILVLIYRNKINIKIYYFGLIFYIISLSLINGYGSYKFRLASTPSDTAGIYICKDDKNLKKNINIYVDSYVDFGFLYFNCPINYNVNYFKDFKNSDEKDTYYIGNYVYKNPEIFSHMEKITETIYYAK